MIFSTADSSLWFIVVISLSILSSTSFSLVDSDDNEWAVKYRVKPTSNIRLPQYHEYYTALVTRRTLSYPHTNAFCQQLMDGPQIKPNVIYCPPSLLGPSERKKWQIRVMTTLQCLLACLYPLPNICITQILLSIRTDCQWELVNFIINFSKSSNLTTICPQALKFIQ